MQRRQDDTRTVFNGKPNLDKHNGLVPKVSWIHTAFYHIEVQPNGKARVFKANSRHFVKAAMASGTPREMPLMEAVEKAKQWDKFIWDNNDRDQLCDDYGLRKSFVREYFGYIQGLDDGLYPWNED